MLQMNMYQNYQCTIYLQVFLLHDTFSIQNYYLFVKTLQTKLKLKQHDNGYKLHTPSDTTVKYNDTFGHLSAVYFADVRYENHDPQQMSAKTLNRQKYDLETNIQWVQ